MTSILFIAALIAFTGYTKGQSKCTTPSGGKGLCVKTKECDSLLNTLKDPQQGDEQTLTSSLCEGNPQKVCCPNQCFTPYGELGSCIGIHSCPYLVKHLASPVSKENVTYIRNHRCEGPDQYSVCCGLEVTKPVTVPRWEKCTLSAAPPYPNTHCCGRDASSDKIIGGDATKIDQHPWLALIEYQNGNQTLFLCGGALISGKYVLTAGHCVIGTIRRKGTPTNVRLGEYDLNHDGPDCVIVDGGGEDCTDSIVTIPIERSIPHHDYDPDHNLRRHDIALLRLARMAPYTDFIRPICLPLDDVTKSSLPALNLTATGWGATETDMNSNVKLQVVLPFTSLQLCQPAYNTASTNITLWEGQLCAGGKTGKDTCRGDSGGPLMYYRDYLIWEITGVVSFGPKICGSEDVSGVYTKVYHYMPWIRSQIRP